MRPALERAFAQGHARATVGLAWLGGGSTLERLRELARRGEPLPDAALDALPPELDVALCELALRCWSHRPLRPARLQLVAFRAALAAAQRLEAHGAPPRDLFAPPATATATDLSRFPFRFYGAGAGWNVKPLTASFAVRFARAPTREERGWLERFGGYGAKNAIDGEWAQLGWFPSSDDEGPEAIEDLHRRLPIAEAINLSWREWDEDLSWDAWSTWLRPIPEPYPDWIASSFDRLADAIDGWRSARGRS